MSSVENEAKLVLDIYEYALEHHMNIEDRNDVIQIMEALNQSDVSNERIEGLMIALQITANKVRSDVDRRKKVN